METIEKLRSEVLLRTLSIFSSRYSRAISPEALIAGLPHQDGLKSPDLLSFSQADTLFSRSAKRAGYKSSLVQKDLGTILELHLPIILLLAKGQSCILEAFNEDKTKVKVIYPEETVLEEWVDRETLEEEYLGFAFLLKKEITDDNRDNFVHKQYRGHWFWDTIKLSWPIYRDVLWASLLVNLFVLASPLFTMSVYDRVIPNNATETLMVFAVGVVMVYFLDSFLKFFRTRMLEVAAKKSDVIMSSIVFERILDLKMSMHPKSVGSFASNIRDFDMIRSFLTNSTMAVLIDLPFAIIFLWVIHYIGGNIVMIPIMMMILIMLYALVIRKPLEESIESTHEASARKNGILIESLHNIETIKTQGMSGQVQWNWEESVGDIAQKSLYSRLLSSSVPIVTGLLVQLTTVLIVIAGVFLIKDLELTMGGLIGIVILSSRTVAPMGQVAALLTNFSDAKSAYETINSIVEQPMERLGDHNFMERDHFKGKIEFRNVTFSYPDAEVPALDNISFVINAGESVGIIGRIGSGKSTIEKLILKLYDPSEGSILIDDIDIAQIDPERLRKYIGYVSQDVVLFRGTLKENILHGSLGSNDEKLLEVATYSGVDEFVKRHPLGYNMPIGERGQGVSGGQRQSIGIARALVSDAPVMLLDEPTNALDPTSETKLMVHFKEAFKDKTLILVTQKLPILKNVDRVIVMHMGRIYLDGQRDAVLKSLNSKASNKGAKVEKK
jgi:ATP-binding cassette subfamily C protein LapB